MERQIHNLTITEENKNTAINLSEDIEYITNFLDDLLYIKKYSQKTVINYTIDLRLYLNYLSAMQKHITEADQKFIRRYISYLNKKEFSIKSIHRKISSLKSIYKYLTRNNFITQNPMLNIQYPKLEKKLPEIMSIKEVEELLNSFDAVTTFDKRDKAICELLYSTGIRVSELTGIKISDIDIISKTIKILGKGNKERLVFLTDRALMSLKDYMNVRMNFISKKENTQESLFLGRSGKGLNSASVYYIIKKHSIRITSGKDISPHTFRHSFATHLMNNGADIRLVQELLGHESITSTQIYTHVSKNRLRDMYRKTHPHSTK